MTDRYYDPGTGRFLTRDPIGYGGGINLYGFIRNNPVTGADPEGTSGDGPLDRLRRAVAGARRIAVDIDRGEVQTFKDWTGIQAVENAFAATARFGHGVVAQMQSDDPESERWNRQNVGNAYNWDRKTANTIPVIVGAGLGGLDATPSGAEEEELVGMWAPDPRSGSNMDSIVNHFGKHGEDMGADSVWRYLRQAKAFRQQLKRVSGRLVEGDTPGVMRYVKQGKYIDLTPEGKIVSFGKVRRRGY